MLRFDMGKRAVEVDLRKPTFKRKKRCIKFVSVALRQWVNSLSGGWPLDLTLMCVICTQNEIVWHLKAGRGLGGQFQNLISSILRGILSPLFVLTFDWFTLFCYASLNCNLFLLLHMLNWLNHYVSSSTSSLLSTTLFFVKFEITIDNLPWVW